MKVDFVTKEECHRIVNAAVRDAFRRIQSEKEGVNLRDLADDMEDASIILNLSVRATNVLDRCFGKSPTLKELCDATEWDISRTRNCGKKTILEIQEAMAAKGRRFAQIALHVNTLEGKE